MSEDISKVDAEQQVRLDMMEKRQDKMSATLEALGEAVSKHLLECSEERGKTRLEQQKTRHAIYALVAIVSPIAATQFPVLLDMIKALIS